jgi:hypothetical protein
MPFSVAAAAIGAAGAIGGGIMSSNASKSAASQQAAQIQKGLDFQSRVYDTTTKNLQPWVGGGQSALSSLLGFYGLPGGDTQGAMASFNNFTNLPSYQFPLQQGQLAIQRSLASSGLIGSGAALRAGNDYAQGYASQNLGSYLSGLSGLSGAGQNAAAMVGSQGNTAASGMLTGFTGIGQAQSAGTMGSANALNQGIQGALGPREGLLNKGGSLGGSSFGDGGGGGGGVVDSGSWTI